jgi:hypothetical protein
VKDAQRRGQEWSVPTGSAEGARRPARILSLPAGLLSGAGEVFAGSHANYPSFRHLFPEGSVAGFVQFIGTGGMPVATGGAPSPPSSERAGTARTRPAPRPVGRRL